MRSLNRSTKKYYLKKQIMNFHIYDLLFLSKIQFRIKIIFTKIFLHRHHKYLFYALLKFSSETIRAYLNRPRAILVTIIVISRRIKADELTFSGWLLSFFLLPLLL